MKMNFTKKLAIVATIVQSLSSIAQEIKNDSIDKTKRLQDVEITATSKTNKSILNQPESISKIESKELKRGNGLFLEDALNTSVTGVFMQKRTVSAGQQFNIRGYGNGIRGTSGTNSNFEVVFS